MTAQPIIEDRRKEVFRALVDAQDQGMTVAASRKKMAEDFRITEEEVQQIEHEGLEKEWPPL